MQSPDIWQTLGTPQVAEITAVISTAISVVLAQRGSQQPKTPCHKKGLSIEQDQCSFFFLTFHAAKARSTASPA
jgi:hypothetical protein